MAVLLLSLLVLGIVCAVLGFVSKKRGESQEIVVAKGDCTSCTDDDPSCEQLCMMKAATEPVEYFDDEELDQYSGRSSDSYTDEEAALFVEVLETLRAEEVKAWGRSLTLRGINMPDAIKDEYIVLAEQQ